MKNTKNQEKIVVITGASNGMGYEAAKTFAQRGWQVYAGARRVEKIPTEGGITSLKLDVTDSESNHAFIQGVLDKTGRIDVLINNAGYGEYGPAEEIPMENVRKQFETNFFGAVELTQLVLPIMRQQKFGRIVNISSIGGDVYMPLGAFYHATKAAMQQWSDVLDTEVRAFGIRSIVVQPGGTASNWSSITMENAEKNLQKDSPYQPLVQTVRAALTENFGSSATSADLAQVFYKAATDKKAKSRYYYSFTDRLIVHAARTYPKLYIKVFNAALKHMGKGKK
ncbi:SDR family NAD(P)-dependent oxidoreductase [Lactococcus garvieae]|uniref:SDR family NAD(P)-dependent oxidoreductase n=1 Tax=Lactococcus garvieae TaxID=1363 RepID=UPI0018DA30BE|nr:SDR family NAD(P)-dependent oxidoreductase [Lactococcus garvieae]QPS71326.1 SDR family NAD(P)-dependent oxidoreductase [Lactococcus garvieae]